MAYSYEASTIVVTGSGDTVVPGIIDMTAIVVKTAPCSIKNGNDVLFTLPVGAFYLNLRSTEGLTFTNDCTIFLQLSSHRGTNQTTINNQGGGGGGGGTWGSITGTLSDQTDLQAALDNKLDIAYRHDETPDGLSGYKEVSFINTSIKPTANAVNSLTKAKAIYTGIDTLASGFDLGTAGTAVVNVGNYISHNGKSHTGRLTSYESSINLGNSIDPITVQAVQAAAFNGAIQNNVTVTSGIEGYTFSPHVYSGANITSGYVQAFTDSTQIDGTSSYYTSAQFSPIINKVGDNKNYTGLSIAATIAELGSTANITGINLSGTYGATAFATASGMTGININPTITNFNSGSYYNGIYSSTQNISGTGTNKWAGFFEGDVNINGSLSFSGALSIGALQAYKAQNIIDGGGNPTSIHSLTCGITAPASSTIADADTIGVNTATIIDIGNNATVTSGPFGLGLVGLALPAVVIAHTGSSLDNLGGAAFALNFDGSSTGGTINQGYGGMFTAIPNGITAVNRWYGVWSRMPFGSLATDNWGVYSEGTDNNYLSAGLKIGGTDKVTNTSIDLEVQDKLTVIGRGDTTARNALTAVNGALWYNTTTDKFQGYAGGTWVDLH